MNSKLTVLLIEDDPIDQEKVFRLLKSGSKEQKVFSELTWASTIATACEQLQKQSFDVILLDLLLPDSNGIDGLNKIQSLTPSTPIIIMSGFNDMNIAMDAVKNGAQDYLIKDTLDPNIIRTLHYAIERKRISDRVIRAELEARQAREAEERFLATMSHEMRTPLTAIIGFAESLTDQESSKFNCELAAKSVLSNAKHLLALVNDILDFSKLGSGTLELESVLFSPLHILQEIELAFRLSAEQRGINLIIDPQFPLPSEIVGDPMRFRQIISNLISNAIRFTDKGEVRIRVSLNRESKQLIVEVIDTGIGIEENKLEKIFEPFIQADTSTTRRYGGTGLGLAISKELAERMLGQLTVSSKIGQGSNFSISLNVGRIDENKLVNILSPLTTTPTTPIEEKIPSLNGTIVLVDDSDDICELIKYFVGLTGVNLVMAHDGKSGIDLINKTQPDLILMDLQMPILDGFGATTELRKQGLKTPVIALTASTVKQQLDKCFAAGFTEFLCKPFERHVFFDLLKKYLQNSASPVRLGGALQLKATIAQVSHNFLSKLEGRVATVELCHNAKNFQQLAEMAHKLASAELFGFANIGNTAKSLELAAIDNKLTECDTLVLELRRLALPEIAKFKNEVL